MAMTATTSDDEMIRLSNELRDLVGFTPEEIKDLNESCRIAIEELRSELENLQ